MKAIVTGDIGCYTLGAGAPFKAVDTVIDMGASLSMAHGMELAGAGEATGRPIIGVIGDSTFAHSGITSSAPSTTAARARSASSTTARPR